MQQRHNLRLADFAYAGAYVYFVTFCTQNRLPLLGSVQILSVGADPCVRPSPPGQMVAQWVKKLEEKFQGVELIASVVMPDHVHILLRGPEREENANLPQMIQWLKTQTTNAYIRGVKTNGFPPFTNRLWQRGYYDHVIWNQRDFEEVGAYIQENPLRWAVKHGLMEAGDGRTHGSAPTRK